MIAAAGGIDSGMRAPRVSIVMAAYNGEPYVRDAIRSVLDQDFADFELVVVDDGSTDGTAATVIGFGDARIRYHRNERNLGQTPSLNVGLRLARGKYIARLDTDDEYLPGKLRRQVEFLDAHPDVALCGTWARCIDEHGAASGVFRAPTREPDVAFRLVWSSPVCHVSVMMRRDPVIEVGGYDESYRYAADYQLWSELVARGHRLVNIPEYLMRYRVFAGSFGGASVLADAGWESAKIISSNARRFCQMELRVEDARAIHLRAHPEYGGEEQRLLAYRALREIARSAYGGLRPLTNAELFAGFVWSVAVAPAGGPRARPRSLGERAGIAAGRLLQRVNTRRLSTLKDAVARVFRPARIS